VHAVKIIKGTLFTGRLSVLTIVAATIFLLGAACNEGHEGDRCNPKLFHDENQCGHGLACQMPSTCVESYCCPSDPTTSTNPFCNGQMCSHDAAATE
jgi:hypothetical protein